MSDRIEQSLLEQREALKASNANFDSGNLWEAKRIAAVAHILFHDGKRGTTSLLTQLELKGRVPFISSAHETDDSHAWITPLLYIDLTGDSCGFRPKCNNPEDILPVELSFDEWYEEIVYKEMPLVRKIDSISSGVTFSRRELIAHLRDKDGGAHVDSNLTESYLGMKSGQGIGVAIFDSNGEICGYPDNANLMTMRQIGWEIEASLNNLFGPVG